MIDLHIHTKYSDGTDKVIEVLNKAENMGLEAISITDHDKVDAYFELENIDVSKYYNGKIIKGAELKTIYNSVPIEILGYGIDTMKIKNSKYIIDQSNIQKKYLNQLKEIGEKTGLKFDDKIKIDDNNIYASSTFGKEIFKHKENEKIIKEYDLGNEGNDFYRNAQSNSKSIFYINEMGNVTSAEKIVDEIHNAGGLAFLAHPLIYPFEDKLKVIEECINQIDLDGLECWYSLFDNEQVQSLIRLCEKYNLYKSGGSDYHGLAKPNIDLGVGKGNLNISIEYVKDWIEKVK